MKLEVTQTWDGVPLEEDAHACVKFRLTEDALTIEVEAPFFGDPAPKHPAGRVDQLWEHEVVELFLLGDGERYLEVEMGPLGHYLVLQLCGTRRVERQALLMEYHATIEGDRWRGTARLPKSFLPDNPTHGNAYAVHGRDSERQYLAAFPCPGNLPAFHRLQGFGPVHLAS